MGNPLRIGIMGFGHIGRHLYRLALQRDDTQVSVINDIARPDILHYLLTYDRYNPTQVKLADDHLEHNKFRTRILTGSTVCTVPWDLFDVDIVLDCTGRFNNREQMQTHLQRGVRRVMISTLPADGIDKVILPGINESEISDDDRLISAGSSTTNALAILLKVLDEKLGIDYANMVTLHAYTSDQSLQDCAGNDYRCSRSAAKNIIPNNNESAYWVSKILPHFKGRLAGSALNVPVQKGSLLDLTLVMKNAEHGVEQINQAMREGAQQYPNLIGLAKDPVVSSDIIGDRHSAVYDMGASVKAGQKMVKTLSWYDNGLSQACRMMDVLNLYRNIDPQESAE